jgi:endonuclease/exonuclease/phosphatase family metal-dependent hydrolase
VDTVKTEPAGRAGARLVPFLSRHRWGVATLAIAAFLWGVGALWTPAPEAIGSALCAVGVLAALALLRLRDRWRGAFAHPERARTQTSLVLYSTSLTLASMFLAGLFLVPRSTLVAGAPPFAPGARPVVEVASLVPSLATVPELAAPRSGDTLRILSFNVWHGYPGPGAREERYQRIRDLVAETDPDVLLLQEAWSTRRFGRLAERLSRELGLGYAYARANGSLRYLGFEEGLAILSRYPISDVRRMALGPRTPPWEMRAALGATLELPGGDQLEVWNTHLSHSDAFAREGQAHSLASALSGSGVRILGGDFNALATNTAVSTFADVDLEPVLSEGIDHILASGALRRGWSVVRTEARRFGEVLSSGGYGARPEVSDHPALLVELRRRGGSAGSPPS